MEISDIFNFERDGSWKTGLRLKVEKTQGDFIGRKERDAKINKIHINEETTFVLSDQEETEIVQESVTQSVVENKSKDASFSSKTVLEVVKKRQGTWVKDLFILNPDPELTETIQNTLTAHR